MRKSFFIEGCGISFKNPELEQWPFSLSLKCTCKILGKVEKQKIQKENSKKEGFIILFLVLRFDFIDWFLFCREIRPFF